MTDGRSWVREGRNVPGNADNPMNWDDVGVKFQECAAVAVGPVGEEVAVKIVALAKRLETLDDATELISILARRR